MTDSTNEPLTDVSDTVVVHRSFRREFRLIPELVRAVPPARPGCWVAPVRR